MTEKEKEVFEKIKGIIVNQMGCSESAVEIDADLSEDLNIGSLDKVEIFIEIEKQFNYEFNDTDMEGIETVRDIVEKMASI